MFKFHVLSDVIVFLIGIASPEEPMGPCFFGFSNGCSSSLADGHAVKATVFDFNCVFFVLSDMGQVFASNLKKFHSRPFVIASAQQLFVIFLSFLKRISKLYTSSKRTVPVGFSFASPLSFCSCVCSTKLVFRA